jgi:hypothetical protein
MLFYGAQGCLVVAQGFISISWAMLLDLVDLAVILLLWVLINDHSVCGIELTGNSLTA